MDSWSLQLKIIVGSVLPCFRHEYSYWEEQMSSDSKDGWAGVIKGKPEAGQSAERSRTTCKQDIVSKLEVT